MDHTATSQLLSRFAPISLGEMDGVKLQDRVDTKYLFAASHLNEVLEAILPHYRVLEVKGVRGVDYRSLYFDTPDRKSYHDHHNGRVLRNKVRFREYIGSDLCFLEVKRKTGRGRTDKVRIAVPEIPAALSAEQEAFIRRSAHVSGPLEAVLWNRFTRLTFVRNDAPERLTMDIDLRFSPADEAGMETGLSGIVVAELKQERADRTSPFVRTMRAMNYRPAGMSKYCIGMLQQHADLKYNQFKQVQRRIERVRSAA